MVQPPREAPPGSVCARYVFLAPGFAPRAQTDIQRLLGVTPPSVHSMILTLERKAACPDAR